MIYAISEILFHPVQYFFIWPFLLDKEILMPELFRSMYIIYQKKIICQKKIRTGKTVGHTSSRQRKLFLDNETHMSYVIVKLTSQNFFRTKKLIPYKEALQELFRTKEPFVREFFRPKICLYARINPNSLTYMPEHFRTK
jgi:hypothetical protein